MISGGKGIKKEMYYSGRNQFVIAARYQRKAINENLFLNSLNFYPKNVLFFDN